MTYRYIIYIKEASCLQFYDGNLWNERDYVIMSWVGMHSIAKHGKAYYTFHQYP